MPNLIEINYYWGDGEFHSSARYLPDTGNIPAMVLEHKPKQASVDHAIVYRNGTYLRTVEVI